jgi:hypothetical protein
LGWGWLGGCDLFTRRCSGVVRRDLLQQPDDGATQFASSMWVNALTKSKPSDVARKSLTKEGEGASADASTAGRLIEPSFRSQFRFSSKVRQADSCIRVRAAG